MVIVGNPPYSVGQKSATDDNPNVSYPRLENRVKSTYAARSKTTLKMSLYDSYKLAIRWASDRIRVRGVMAFVTNGSFIDGNAESGLRACLADEFSHLYVFNLRGNARTSGERRRQEKDNVFGQGSRTPVAIMVLVRDPAHRGDCQIHYKNIGDYLSQAEKLRIIEGSGSIAGITDWQRILPDEHNDWLEQRNPEYQAYMPLGSKEAKNKNSPELEVVARTYSSGVKTNSDAWLYDSSHAELASRTQRMVSYYEVRRQQVESGKMSLQKATHNDAPDRFKWHADLRDRFQRNICLQFRQRQLRPAMYRPFVKQMLYFDATLIQRRYQIPSMFLTPVAPNRVIGVTGRGDAGRFYSLMTEMVPDVQVLFNGQWFSRWRYEAHDPDRPDAWVQSEDEDLEAVPGFRRIDNINRLVPAAVPNALPRSPHHKG